MFFTFNGTAVYVYGSKRFNHGVYSGELAISILTKSRR